MTSQIATRRRLRPGAFLTGSLIALVSLTGLAATPARAQEEAPEAGPGFLPVVGTWTRGGVDSVAWVDLDTWYLVTSTDGGNPFADPQPQPWRPVAGDWDGDGIDTIQMFDVASWRLAPAERGPAGEVSVGDPIPWVPVAGDWDGDGLDTVLVFDQRDESLHRLEEGPIPVERYDPSPQPWQPVAGDWDGDGVDTLATFQHVETTPTPAPIWISVAGDWDGDGIDSVAGLHMPSGRLALTEEESLFRGSASAAAGPDVLFAPNGGSCTTKIKNVTYIQGKKYYSLGVWTPWCKKSWEEWTCCLVSLMPFKYSCSVVKKSKTYDTTCPPPDFWP